MTFLVITGAFWMRSVAIIDDSSAIGGGGGGVDITTSAE